MLIIAFSVNILTESILTAYAASNPLDTIRKYVQYMGHDWNKLAELYESDAVDGYIEFFNNEDCINNNVGILNVNNAEFCLGYYDSNATSSFICYVDSDCKQVTNRTTMTFRIYCLGVTAGESTYTDLDGHARKAIVMAIKTYTWFYLIYPMDSSHGVNLKVWNKETRDGKVHYTGMQDFAPFNVGDNAQITVDYNAMVNM